MHHYSIHHYFVYLQVQSWLWSTWVRTRQSCVVFCVSTAWRQRWAAARLSSKFWACCLRRSTAMCSDRSTHLREICSTSSHHRYHSPSLLTQPSLHRKSQYKSCICRFNTYSTIKNLSGSFFNPQNQQTNKKCNNVFIFMKINSILNKEKRKAI